MIKVASIFETPLFLCQIEDHDKWVELASQQLEGIKSGQSDYSFKTNDQCDGLRHTVVEDAFGATCGNIFPKKWLNKPGWEELREQIKSHLHDAYIKFLGSGYMENQHPIITDSWVNVCDAGGFQFFHNHGNSVLSWTYFMRLKPEEGHAQLAFNRPEVCNRPFFALPQGGSKYMDSVAIPDCREGCMLIWPGHLIHGYKHNEVDGRMSLSGNSVPSVIRNNGYVLKVIEE